MPFPFPPLGVDSALLPFAGIALAMIAVTIFVFGIVLPPDGRPPLLSQFTLALSVLGGGSLLLLALLFVFLNPNGTSAWTWVLLAFNFMMMVPAGLWVIGVVIFRERRISRDGWAWPVVLAVVTTGSEVLMGVLFVIGGATAPLDPLTTAALGLSSVWFFWSMAAVMAALLLWAPLSRIEREALLALAGSAVLGPWVTTFPTVGGISMTALMVGVFAVLLHRLRRGSVRPNEMRLAFALSGAFLAMAIGGALVAAGAGAPIAALGFGTVMGFVMGGEVAYLVRKFYRDATGIPWIARVDGDRPVPGNDRSAALLDPPLPDRSTGGP